MKDKKILICILDVLMFAALLFMGADTLSAEYKDISIRYVQIIFPICFILLGYLRAYNFKHMKYFMPFIVIFFISTIFAINFWDGFLYFLWLIYNIAFITFVVASYIKFSGLEKFLKLFRLTIYNIVILLIIQSSLLNLFQLKLPFLNHQEYLGIYRPCLWFYEPSYLVTYFSFSLAYFVYKLICNKEIKFLKDVVVICIAMLLSTSSTGYLAIIFTFFGTLILVLFNKNIKLKAKLITIVTSASFILICIAMIYILNPNAFETFFMRIINNGISDSAGGRVSNYDEMWSVFKENPLLGVGPNNYHNYFQASRDMQPTNTTLEVLATTGILGFISSTYLIGCLLYYSRGNKDTNPFKYGIVIFMLIMQANQNFMRLYLWAYLGMLLGCIFVCEKKKKIKTIYINGLFLTQSLTGIQRLCYEFSERLKSKYNNIRFIILAPKKQKIDIRHIKIDVKRIGVFKGILWEQISLPFYMFFKPYATLWNLGNDAPILYPGTTMIHDVIFYEEDYNKGLWSLKSRIITNLNANRYDKIICPSNTTKQRILDLFPAIDNNEIVVCNPSYDHILKFGDKQYQETVKNYYLSVSSIMRNKNFGYIIELAKLRKKDNFIVIGKKGKIKEMFKYIPSNVHFTGYVKDEALKQLYSKCKGFISPSLYEGFGVPPLEAMGFGCEKIYISSIDVYKEVYSDSVMYFDPYNVKDLDEKLDEKYSYSKEKRKKLLQKYKWDNFTRDFLRYNVD